MEELGVKLPMKFFETIFFYIYQGKVDRRHQYKHSHKYNFDLLLSEY